MSKANDWVKLPRSSATHGVSIAPRSKVGGGVVVLFDAEGLAASGLRSGARVSAELSGDGCTLKLFGLGGPFKLSHDVTSDERKAGYCGRLAVEGVDAPGGAMFARSIEKRGEHELLIDFASSLALTERGAS